SPCGMQWLEATEGEACHAGRAQGLRGPWPEPGRLGL
ncbi:hypothetical protein IOCL2689_000373600, partial [Leishmania utingensis]